jgi:hypothetical protein
MTVNPGDEFVDQILTSLKIISMIKEGQKVCVRNGLLSLEAKSSGLRVAFRRWVNNDNRSTTISYVKNVINNALDIVKIHSDQRTICKIKKSLSDCITGLSSLAVTYDTDASVTATIAVMQDRIRTNTETQGECENRNPPSERKSHKSGQH